MKVPLSWLRDFVEVDSLPVSQLAYKLTMAGLEVEDVHHLGANWRDVAIARVTDLQKHPRAESLWVATLDRGGGSTTIVTAAPNLHVGALVPHVAPGGTLPAGGVGQRTFNGITSEGMVCSGDELGISADKEGIYLLEDEAPVGQQLADYLADTVLDIYVTANRPDCMCIVGIAREVHAITGAPWRKPTWQPPSGSTPAADLVGVRVEDPVGCPRFTAAVVQGVQIAASPLWLQRRLYLAGTRAISNVVDITNYVMLELGQPLHAFDRALLNGSIVVRRAADGEKLTTLDGQQRTLTSQMMVVADEQAARSLAGIMGGADSEINDTTRDVVLEGASWDRAAIRGTSSALGLASEASRRFGRGVDPELTAAGVSRAAELTVKLAGGTATDGLVDVYPGHTALAPIRVTPEQIAGLLGVRHPREQVVSILRSLDFGVDEQGEALEVQVPTHRRFDVTQRADLAEEVARIAGYELVPTTLIPGRVPQPRADGDATYAAELLARRTLAAAGLQEVITYSLVEPALAARLDASKDYPADHSTGGAIELLNPLSGEASALRATLLGSLLETVRSNLRTRDRVLLFELARTWHGELDPLPDERRLLGIALTGSRQAAHWSGETQPLDYFDLKGLVDRLGQAYRVELQYAPAAHPSLHPGRSAEVRVRDTRLGWLGQLHPVVAERFDLEDGPVLVAELDFEHLLAVRQPFTRAHTPSRYPPSERDIAVVVAESAAHADVQRAIREAGGDLLTSVRVFDVYRGEQIGTGRKSLAYTLTFQAADRTLADEEIAQLHSAVEHHLEQQFGAEIRGR